MAVLCLDPLIIQAVLSFLTLVFTFTAVGGPWETASISLHGGCIAWVKTTLWKTCYSFQGDAAQCEAYFLPPECDREMDGTFHKPCQVFVVLSLMLTFYAILIRPVVPKILVSVQPNTLRKATIASWAIVSLFALVAFCHFVRLVSPEQYESTSGTVTERFGYGFATTILVWLCAGVSAVLAWRQDESDFEVDLEAPSLTDSLYSWWKYFRFSTCSPSDSTEAYQNGDSAEETDDNQPVTRTDFAALAN
eukprot:gb/GEZN01017021.1/.p1 GENE.gb/GEZN01017021.1/~~gb/GEZN01017021.1/.p1  ORF type:complete len:249 (-),score=15.86 gb/GEZN01017021.1/:39-785(-)